MRRIVCTGSESTGKTTLAQALASRFGAIYVPEFVRAFAAQLGRPIDFSDHGAIARGQMALEDEALSRGDDIIVQDTDLLSTVVYCRHYFGRCPPWIEEEAHNRRPHVYLLCDVDLPWEADGIRDRGEARDSMQALFRDAVAASGVPCVEIRGAGPARGDHAMAALRQIDRSGPWTVEGLGADV
jgi:NadR type nicotinamide-nucleotide adenylyltransferase